jgi:NAD(P)-dependent dehydrogenase (short-subunit alcohol dehydrogenase family)
MSRKVLVTGGSSGIGRAIVRRFVAAGDVVWFTYRTGQDRADALSQELATQAPGRVRMFELSQGESSSHDELLSALPDEPDVLVNNAAVGSKTVERHVPGSRQEREAAFFQVNCVGPLWLAQGLIPGMAGRGYGKVVNVASVAGGAGPFPGFQVADGMSKAALVYMTRHLAAELVHSPVDVFAVCPGAVDTAMFAASTLEDMSPGERAALEHRLPRRRLIEPEEIAEVVWWLCSDAARVLHGAVIDASMGLAVHPGLLTGSVDSLERIG